jgi:hypothetical protein
MLALFAGAAIMSQLSPRPDRTRRWIAQRLKLQGRISFALACFFLALGLFVELTVGEKPIAVEAKQQYFMLFLSLFFGLVALRINSLIVILHIENIENLACLFTDQYLIPKIEGEIDPGVESIRDSDGS